MIFSCRCSQACPSPSRWDRAAFQTISQSHHLLFSSFQLTAAGPQGLEASTGNAQQLPKSRTEDTALFLPNCGDNSSRSCFPWGLFLSVPCHSGPAASAKVQTLSPCHAVSQVLPRRHRTHHSCHISMTLLLFFIFPPPYCSVTFNQYGKGAGMN